MKKQTALDYFLQELRVKYPMIDLDFKRQINKAEAMNYEQYIQAYSTGWHEGQEVMMLNRLKTIKAIEYEIKKVEDAAEQYYNDTYA